MLETRHTENIRIVHRKCGGWLALSPTGFPLQIGVTAETEEGARASFAQTLARWEALLCASQEVAASSATETDAAQAA